MRVLPGDIRRMDGRTTRDDILKARLVVRIHRADGNDTRLCGARAYSCIYGECTES